jgi:bifunctional diaminopimelate decarboxylase / aspartate kinase
MTTRNTRWIVLKFGGTSVSNLPNWNNIATVAKRRAADGANVLIVHSAVSGITDRLEKLLNAALTGEHGAALEAIVARHRQLCDELGVASSAQLDGYFAELQTIAHPPHPRDQ